MLLSELLSLLLSFFERSASCEYCFQHIGLLPLLGYSIAGHAHAQLWLIVRHLHISRNPLGWHVNKESLRRFRWYYNKTTRVWCAVWQYHWVWVAEPVGRRWSSATPNKVIFPHSTPDEGCFVFMPCYSYSFIYPYLTVSLWWQN